MSAHFCPSVVCLFALISFLLPYLAFLVVNLLFCLTAAIHSHSCASLGVISAVAASSLVVSKFVSSVWWLTVRWATTFLTVYNIVQQAYAMMEEVQCYQSSNSSYFFCPSGPPPHTPVPLFGMKQGKTFQDEN